MNAKLKRIMGLLSGAVLLGGAWMVWQPGSRSPPELAKLPEQPERWEQPADKVRYLRARLPVERRSLEVVREALAEAKKPLFPDRERVRQLEAIEQMIAARVRDHESELNALGE